MNYLLLQLVLRLVKFFVIRYILMGNFNAKDSSLPAKSQLKLHDISETLQELDVIQHHLKLYEQLCGYCDNPEDVFNPVSSPLTHHRLYVDIAGLLRINSNEEGKIQYSPYEAKRVAIGIYHLAYSYSLKPETDSTYYISNALRPMLMKPFLELYGTQEVREINNALRQLTYSLARRIEQTPASSAEEEQVNSAVKIQRAFRVHRYIQSGVNRVEDISPELQENLDYHYIPRKPNFPADEVDFTPEQKKSWAEQAKPGYRHLAEDFAKFGISYRSHAKFMKRFADVIQQFNVYLASLPLEQANYVMVVPSIKDNRKLKSNHWVCALALPLLVKKPMAVLFPQEIDAYISREARLSHLVFLDDAVYSGRQLRTIIQQTNHIHLNKLVLLPFYTDVGINRIGKEHHFILGEMMLRPVHWLKDTSIIDAMFNGYSKPASSKVGTFFQHKIADDVSTYLEEYGNEHLHNQSENIIPVRVRETIKTNNPYGFRVWPRQAECKIPIITM